MNHISLLTFQTSFVLFIYSLSLSHFFILSHFSYVSFIQGTSGHLTSDLMEKTLMHRIKPHLLPTETL